MYKKHEFKTMQKFKHEIQVVQWYKGTMARYEERCFTAYAFCSLSDYCIYSIFMIELFH